MPTHFDLKLLAKGYLNALFVIPADVGVNYLNELLNGCSLPVPGVEQLRFQSPEEALTGSNGGRALTELHHMTARQSW